MSKQQVSQQLFMKVKQRLDYYRLPSTFPIEATVLLNKLLRMIDSKEGSQDFQEAIQFNGELVSASLKQQIGRLVKENNQLHMNLIVEKEQIQSLQHQLFKTKENKHSSENELQKIVLMKTKREQELVSELQAIKYKYNQLMDFLHEDPRAEKDYIKRLMKHKKIDVNDIQMEAPYQSNLKRTINEDNRIKQLETKVRHREGEILRLQKVIQYDGVNLNKLIKNFNEDLVKKRLKGADNKINYLEQSYDKIKKENQSMRSKNGLREALRSEVQKCHQIIDTLKKENQELKRNHKEQNFDIEKRTSENHRKISRAKVQKNQAQIEIGKLQNTINDYAKKTQHLEKQLKEARESSNFLKEAIEQKEEVNSNLKKKNQETKIMFQYELQTLTKRKQELQSELEETRAKARELLAEYELKSKENELKTESIINLEKIVNELIRKNSLLADHTVGTLQESLKQSAQLELKNRLAEQERQVILAQNQKIQTQTNMRVLENRFERIVAENQQLRYENGKIRGQLSSQGESLRKYEYQIDEMRHILKKENAQKTNILNQIDELKRNSSMKIAELQDDNERLRQQEKSLKTRLKDIEIKTSGEEGAWEATRIRLQDKETKIKQLEKLLSEKVEQNKALANQINELQHETHELTKEKQRLGRKYEELKKDEDQFKSTSFRNYEISINDNLTEISDLKKEIMRLTQAHRALQERYEEVNNLISVLRREKELIQFDKITLEQQSEILKTRIMEMQEIERALVLQNQSLRALTRSL